MKWTSAARLGLIAGTTHAVPASSGSGDLRPSGGPPAGCKPDYTGQFEVLVDRVGKRDVARRAGCGNPDALLLTLSGGVLKDSKGRTGYIASNYQFQFDGPPQAGSIYTAGFSVCANSSLALGPNTVWYQCLSGDFYNLYDRNWAPQCEPIDIVAVSCQTQAHTTAVVPIGQIGDGQVQAHSTPCGSSAAAAEPTAAPITQISDGQPQAPAGYPGGLPITQISDGQPQAPHGQPSGLPITQISDGQPQAPHGQPSGLPITQISDGQPQAPHGQPSGLPITQISDGQPQAPHGQPSGLPITQISDGQPQAPHGQPSSHPAAQTSVAASQTPSSRPSGPLATRTAGGLSSAAGPTGTNTGVTSTSSPLVPAVPANYGFRAVPGAKEALAIALLAVIAF